MINTTPRQPAGRKYILTASQILQALHWPFTHRYAAPGWLALRLYLGWVWLQFSISKFQSGWLTSDPIGMLFTSIAKGSLPVPLPFYRDIAASLLGLGVSPLISHIMPFLELAVALAFLSGVLVTPAAVGAILLNTNIILSGIGILAFDGRIIVIQLLLIMARRVAGQIGLERLLMRSVAYLKSTARHND
jgi:uncharacterized membrane protein YphA (DoxX/SURF4 family)